jgi:hypothetical protein
VVWYGDSVDVKDANAVLLQYELPDGKYELTFADGQEKKVDTEQLANVLSRMLVKRKK